MQVDTSIYNALGRGVKSVRDWQVEDEQRTQAAQAQELNALNLGNARATAADNALARQDQSGYRNALSGLAPGATVDDQIRAAEGARNPYATAQAQAMRKAQLEDQAKRVTMDKDRAATEASAYKTRLEKADRALKDIAAFTSPGEALADLQRKAAAGEVPAEQAQVLAGQLQQLQTPEQWGEWQRMTRYRILDAKDQLEQEWKAKEFGLKSQESIDRRTNQAGEAANRDLVLDPSTGKYVVNQPLQNAKVARAAAGAAPGAPQPVTYFTAGDGQVYPLPTKVGAGGPGQVAPVTGPGGKPLAGKGADITEGERNAGGYHARMVEATKLLDKFEESGRQTYGTRALEAVPIVGRAAAGEAMTATQQQYKQAQADWVRAKLRKESGAAIGVDEMAQEIATYFPTPWDGPENVAQKKQAREVANKAMAGAAGRGVQQPPATAAPAGMPDAAAIDAELARRAKGK